jgi:hypothetical protein
MNPVTRLSLIFGCFFAIASVVIAVVYFHFSPMWQASQATEAVSHACLKTLDSAIELLLTFMVFATVGFFYLSFYARKHS